MTAHPYYPPGAHLGGVMVSRDLIHRYLRQLADEYDKRPATIQTYRKAYEYFCAYLYRMGLTAKKTRITPEHVRAWRLDMQGQGLSPATIRVRLAACSTLFGLMHREGILKGNPFAAVARPKLSPWRPKGALTPGQLMALWNQVLTDGRSVGHQNRAAMCLLCDCGVRRGEVLRTEWQDLGLLKRKWRVEGKGGKERWVALSERTVRYLLILWERRGRPISGPVFLSRTGMRLSQTSFYGTVKRYARLAGIPHISPHWLRHTWASEMAETLRSPADLAKMQRLLGHASPETTMVYVHVLEEDQEFVDRMLARRQIFEADFPQGIPTLPADQD
jgi:site-specific recombinase XerD